MELVLGITGGVGAGKSRILEILRQEYGARIIQADQVAAALEEPGEPGLLALTELFGTGILNQEGSLDRKAFAQRMTMLESSQAREAFLFSKEQVMRIWPLPSCKERVRVSYRLTDCITISIS